MSSIVASYCCMQFQGKVIIQIQENGEKPQFGSNLGTLDPNLAGKNFSKICLFQLLDIMVSYYHVQYKKNLMIQSWENLVTDEETGGEKGRQTDGREWFHRTLSGERRGSNQCEFKVYWCWFTQTFQINLEGIVMEFRRCN